MRVLWIVGGVFLLIGLFVLLVLSAVMRGDSEFEARAARVQGTVTDLSWHRSDKRNGPEGYYYPEVAFTEPGGQRIEFTGSVGTARPSYTRGEIVNVLYDPANPRDARIDSASDRMLLPLGMGGMGGVFTFVGGLLLTIALRKLRQRKWLSKHGTRVQARLEGVELDYSTSVNGRNPWCVRAQWQHPATKKIYVFESDSIWFDPRPYVQRETVDVVINANNPKQYVVDVSFLPKMA